ncbi:MAG: ABC transporter ATP-binding protein/permease [Oscillospiraceae bacterium]|nr:ABC transporter ATP-binding protein/permease [Oscillospiraceae bacterium]
MFKLLKRLGAQGWFMICASLVFVVAQVWLDLRVPDYMASVTRIVSSPGGTVGDVMVEGGKMMLCAIGSVATAVIVGYFASKVAAAFSHRLRGDVFRRVESFSMEEISGFSTASLITRTTNDITQIQLIVAIGLQVVIRAPIMAVWAIGKISTKNWEWTVLTGGFVAFIIIVILTLMAYAMPRFRKIQTLTDNLNRVTRENLTGIRVVRAYNAESYQEAKFEEANSDFTTNSLQVNRAMQIMNPVMRLVMTGLSLGIFWIGAFLIDAAQLMDKIQIFSDMVVFSQYAMQVIMSLMMLTIVFIMLPRVMVSVNRVNEVLDTEPKILDGKGLTGPGGNVAGEVEFRRVSFKYPDAEEYVLRDISFKAKRGETVAFIGSTGSGKSTLINLIPRFYDATEGQVLIDGVDVKDYAQSALRDRLGYIPQRAVLFRGTVSSNVAFGENGKRPADEKDIKRAVRVAQADEFVEEMEDGYGAHIAQGGTNVSGGQKQRLAIARAICRKPEIYIFDDTFSALDFRTDRELRSALRRETAGATNLIVAQRIGTIRDADRIVVLDEGELVGMGTHSELMETCAVYQEIAYSQLSKEELGHE